MGERQISYQKIRNDNRRRSNIADIFYEGHNTYILGGRGTVHNLEYLLNNDVLYVKRTPFLNKAISYTSLG